MTEKASGQTSTKREADAVNGDRSFGYEEGSPGRFDAEGEEFPLSLLTAVAERGGRVDMALDKMSPQPGADLEGSLEIHAIAGSSCSQVGSVQGFGSGLDLEGLAGGGHNGQAATADGHALAELERFVGGKIWPGDRQTPPAVFWNDLLEPTQSFNQSREHVHALLVARDARAH